MKTQIIPLFCLVLSIGLVNAQKVLEQPHPNLVAPSGPIEIDQKQVLLQNKSNQIHHEDPFAKRTSPEHGKKRHPRNDHHGFPSDSDTEQVWQTYKPFVYDDEKDQSQGKRKINTHEFNEILKWGMLAGTAFLVFILIKACTKKRGRREMRRVMEEAQRRRQPVSQPNPHVYFYHSQPQIQQAFNTIPKQSQENLDEKILHAEIQLNRLKELKQQNLRQQFNRKKIQEEQKRIEMVNVQRKQTFHQRQNNWNVGYGPVFYGQQKISYVQQHPVQQPFQVQGIEPIRQRSNSFKTQVSEQPILSNQIKYRNGIPVGRPIRQNDNDSSFASEYPEV